MIAGFFRELNRQLIELARLLRTREFWIYLSVIIVFFLIAVAGAWLAMGFDPLTRGWLSMGFSCRTGEGQLATIIIGSFVFAMTCLFTLGEVVSWVEEMRESRAPGRHYEPISYWRPMLHIAATLVIGIGGFSLMRMWCT